jgi:hypothetical protein
LVGFVDMLPFVEALDRVGAALQGLALAVALSGVTVTAASPQRRGHFESLTNV